MAKSARRKPKPAKVVKKPDARKRPGRPNADAIRWTISQAAREFGWDTTNLERARRAAGVNAGEDGRFSTRQIARVVFGDKESEVIENLRQQRRAAELKYAQASAELIPTASVVKLADKIIVPIRQRIMSSPLADQDKRDILTDLEALGGMDWAAEVRRA